MGFAKLNHPTGSSTIVTGDGAVTGVSLTTAGEFFENCDGNANIEAKGTLWVQSESDGGIVCTGSLTGGTMGTMVQTAAGDVKVFAGAGASASLGGPDGPSGPPEIKPEPCADTARVVKGLNLLNQTASAAFSIAGAGGTGAWNRYKQAAAAWKGLKVAGTVAGIADPELGEQLEVYTKAGDAVFGSAGGPAGVAGAGASAAQANQIHGLEHDREAFEEHDEERREGYEERADERAEAEHEARGAQREAQEQAERNERAVDQRVADGELTPEQGEAAKQQIQSDLDDQLAQIDTDLGAALAAADASLQGEDGAGGGAGSASGAGGGASKIIGQAPNNIELTSNVDIKETALSSIEMMAGATIGSKAGVNIETCSILYETFATGVAEILAGGRAEMKAGIKAIVDGRGKFTVETKGVGLIEAHGKLDVKSPTIDIHGEASTKLHGPKHLIDTAELTVTGGKLYSNSEMFQCADAEFQKPVTMKDTCDIEGQLTVSNKSHLKGRITGDAGADISGNCNLG